MRTERGVRCRVIRRLAALRGCMAMLGLVWFSQVGAATGDANPDMPSLGTPNLSFSSVATQRFVASHGQRAVLMGYPQTGLEFLAYPLQIVSGYQIGFQPEGASTETDARPLLSRVIATPEGVTRIYAGPDYVVRETLFVPIDQPAAIIRYDVDAAQGLNIVVHFAPVLDLMWPAAMGGQTVRWNGDAAAYVMSEAAHGFDALIGSNQSIAHDATMNSALHADGKLAFMLRPQRAPGSDASTSTMAQVFIELLPQNARDPVAAMRALETQADQLHAAATGHYREMQQAALSLHTPDAALNDALAWAAVALDQSWVCNPQLGCGVVAGYGPSRPGRRPQYAWYFAGDGLLATEAMIASGLFARARDELEFIARYQDRTSGMIWHELAQSANYLDWAKYPYMFVHVDISFAYLGTVAHYVAASGDKEFALKHWDSIDSAYRYCESLIRAQDHLPHIPSDKSGGDEQHSPADDLGLSASWVAGAQSFAELAALSGHADRVNEARTASELARKSIGANYWDAKRRFWIDSHGADGAAIFSRASGPGSAIGANLFSPAQNEQLLDQIASATFQTDWGTRGIGSDSTIYAPWSYATGSIFAVHSTQSAQTFWQAHRPQIAWNIFQGIVPWSTVDAPGHIHEVFAGNYFRAQTESVPEQTWSSAGLLDAAVRGLFGIEIRAAQNTIRLQPHMPAEWHEMSAQNIHLPKSTLAFTLRHDAAGLDLHLRNTGDAVAVQFEPEIPLGATVISAQCDGAEVVARATSSGQDTHAILILPLVRAASHCHLNLAGGAALIVPPPQPQIGDASRGIKLTRLQLHPHRLSFDADVHAAGPDRVRLQTRWKIHAVDGATLQPLSSDLYELRMLKSSKPAPALSPSPGYASLHVEVAFEAE